LLGYFKGLYGGHPDEFHVVHDHQAVRAFLDFIGIVILCVVKEGYLRFFLLLFRKLKQLRLS